MKTTNSKQGTICKDFLTTEEYAVIATSSKQGSVDAAVVTYIMKDDWTIYFFTRSSTKKAANLKANNQVSLVVGTGPKPKSAQINGTATLLTEAESSDLMTDFLIKRVGFYNTFLKLEGYDFQGYRVTPTHIRWLNIEENDTNETYVDIHF